MLYPAAGGVAADGARHLAAAGAAARPGLRLHRGALHGLPHPQAAPHPLRDWIQQSEGLSPTELVT